jgi:hypothetical protein
MIDDSVICGYLMVLMDFAAGSGTKPFAVISSLVFGDDASKWALGRPLREITDGLRLGTGYFIPLNEGLHWTLLYLKEGVAVEYNSLGSGTPSVTKRARDVIK